MAIEVWSEFWCQWTRDRDVGLLLMFLFVALLKSRKLVWGVSEMFAKSFGRMYEMLLNDLGNVSEMSVIYFWANDFFGFLKSRWKMLLKCRGIVLRWFLNVLKCVWNVFVIVMKDVWNNVEMFFEVILNCLWNVAEVFFERFVNWIFWFGVILKFVWNGLKSLWQCLSNIDEKMRNYY